MKAREVSSLARRLSVSVALLASVAGGANPANADIFTDGFEGPTLDPFWTTREDSGAITLSSTGQIHGGSQAAQFNSTYYTGQKNVWLLHDHGEPMYGRVSVWMYDTGADVSSSNYLGLILWDQAGNQAGSISTSDYDLGSPAGGSTYGAGFAGVGGPTTFDRTQAWHLFEMELGPDSATAWIDNTVVWTHSTGVSFQSLGIRLSGPTWRPAWVAYYDDFEANVTPVSPPGTPTLAWSQSYGGLGSAEGRGLAVDGAAVYVTGTTWPVGARYTSDDMILLKYDLNGNPLWDRQWGGAHREGGSRVAVAGNAVFVAGYTFTYAHDPLGDIEGDGVTVKWNDAGVLNSGNSADGWWTRFFGDNGYYGSDGASDLAIDALGNLYVAGSSERGWGNPWGYLERYDAGGVGQWHDHYGAFGANKHYRRGGVALSGDTLYSIGSVQPSGDYQAAAWRHDTAGSPAWEYIWGDPGTHELGLDIAVSGADIYATGYRSGGPDGQDIFLSKLHDDGASASFVSGAAFAGVGNDVGYGIALGNGTVYVVGSTDVGGHTDALLLAYDTNLNLLWDLSWGGAGDDSANDVAIDNGIIYVTGMLDGQAFVNAYVPGAGAVCGDASVDPGEACDDGGESATCDADCTFAQCGDGTVNVTAGEACDDGGESPACNADCTVSQCGDGTVNVTAGEACDDAGESVTCDTDCTIAQCGDGTVNAASGEACDDGDAVDGDGCSATCTVESGYNCAGTPSICTPACGDGTCGVGEDLCNCPVDCASGAENLALNPTRTGFPHPLESDNGWGGGADKWDIVDGNPDYPHWANGLAFTGGNNNWAGQPAGLRQATIDYGQMHTFDEVVVWHHGGNDVPATAMVEYWNGTSWVDIGFSRYLNSDFVGTPGYAGWSKPDTYLFDGPVTGSKVRYSFDNSGNSVLGTPMRHGWIYEFDVFLTGCASAQCGDGTVNVASGEACDDGNSQDGDGCSATCATEPGFVCSGEPSTCAPDLDGDQVPDGQDNCPDTPNADQLDGDGDGVGDACDPCPVDNPDDTDGDGACDDDDICPGFNDSSDADSDMVPDGCDNCPGMPNGVGEAGVPGVGNQTDSDGDWLGDACDGCPADPAKTEPGICGCGAADGDGDGDGTADCDDLCPADPGKIDPGICDCGVADVDSDGDGAADCIDECPTDSNKAAPGVCGCGIPDYDTDGDGTADCNDNCPDVANIDQANSDGDSFGDACDNCPLVSNEAQLDADANGIGGACEACFGVNHLKLGTKQAKCEGIELLEVTSCCDGVGDQIVKVYEPEVGNEKLAANTVVNDAPEGTNGPQTIHTSCSQPIQINQVFGEYKVTNLSKLHNEDDDERGNKFKMRGTFSAALPIDLALDDVMYTIDDGQGHALTLLIPAGSFVQEGNPEKQKFEFESHEEDSLEIKARFDFIKCEFRLDAEGVQNTNQISGTNLTVRLEVGANIGQETVTATDKHNHLEFKSEPKQECCPQ